MTDQELKNIWKQSNKTERVKMKLSQLLMELRMEAGKLNQKIKQRDRREIGASYFGIFLFALLAIHFPFPLTKLACVLTILWFVYVIYRLKKEKKGSEIDFSDSIKTQLIKRKSFLKRQAHMLNTVYYWYVLPPFIINVIFLFGIGNVSEWKSPLAEIMPETLREKLFCLGTCAILYIYVIWTNRKAARIHYLPLIKDIEKIQVQLDQKE